MCPERNERMRVKRRADEPPKWGEEIRLGVSCSTNCYFIITNIFSFFNAFRLILSLFLDFLFDFSLIVIICKE